MTNTRNSPYEDYEIQTPALPPLPDDPFDTSAYEMDSSLYRKKKEEEEEEKKKKDNISFEEKLGAAMGTDSGLGAGAGAIGGLPYSIFKPGGDYSKF